MNSTLLARLFAILALLAATGCELFTPESIARGASGSTGSTGSSGSSGGSGSSGSSGSGGTTGAGCFPDAGLPRTTLFGPFTPLSTPSFTPDRLQAGDISGDGRPDLVISVGSDHLETFVASGDGGFDDFDEGTGQNGGSYWSDFALVDWNGDGLGDLIVADPAYHVGGVSRIGVLLATGTPGRFISWLPPVFASYDNASAAFSAVAAVGGAKPEAYALSSDGQTLVLWQPASGGTTAAMKYSVGIGAYPNAIGRVASVSSGYFNADGTRALAFAGQQNYADGGGSGYAGAHYDTDDTGSPGFLAQTAPGTTLLRVADYGRFGAGMQVSLLYEQGGTRYVQVYRSGSGATSSKPVPLPGCAGPVVAMVSGDFDGDGNPDVAVGISGMDVLVLRGLANGDLGPVEELELPFACNGYLAVADFDGDGRDDLATSCAGFHGALIYPGQ